METNRLTVLQGVWKKDLHDTPKGSQSSFFLLTVRLERRKQKHTVSAGGGDQKLSFKLQSGSGSAGCGGSGGEKLAELANVPAEASRC